MDSKGVPLNTVPFENLKIGDRVISAKGRPGKIIILDELDDYSICMEWDDYIPGKWKFKVSIGYHHQLSAVIYIGATK